MRPGAALLTAAVLHLAAAVLLLAVMPADAGEAEADPGPWLEASAVVPAAPEAVLAVLLDWEAYPDWYPGLTRMRVLEPRDRGAVVHGLHRLPWPLRSRDYVVEYRLEEGARGVALSARSVPWPADPEAASEGAVRLARVASRWEIEALPGGGARVVYGVEDASGLPGWLARRRFESTWTHLIRGLEIELTRREGRESPGSGLVSPEAPWNGGTR